MNSIWFGQGDWLHVGLGNRLYSDDKVAYGDGELPLVRPMILIHNSD